MVDTMYRPQLSLLGDDELDLEFFDGVFEDVSSDDDLVTTKVSTSRSNEAMSLSPPISTNAPSSDHWRQSRLVAEIKHCLPETEIMAEWRQIAKHQQKKREISEKENAKLRQLIAAQFQANRRIAKLFKEAVDLESSNNVLRPDTALVTPVKGLRDDIA